MSFCIRSIHFNNQLETGGFSRVVNTINVGLKGLDYSEGTSCCFLEEFIKLSFECVILFSSLQLWFELTDILNDIEQSILIVVSVTECHIVLGINLDNFPLFKDAHCVPKRFQ